MAAEKKVVLLMGNTGVGKSSVGCRLLGFEPASEGTKPFKVESTGQSVTLHVDTKDGTWFGNPKEPALRVVDTPGLGDARGTTQDNKNMVEVGTYLDTNPVHCILLVCQAACPRVDNNTKGLLNILANKIAPKDFAKLGVIVNVYSHHDLARQQRSYNSKPRGQSEAEIQAGMREEFAGSLRHFSASGRLLMQEEDIATLVSHTFFVDSHYTPFTDPEANHKAFVQLANWACTCGELDRSIMSVDMAAVNQEFEEAIKLKQAAEDTLKTGSEEFEQELAAAREQQEKEIAAIKAKSEQRAKEVEHDREVAHKKAMDLEGEKRVMALKQADEKQQEEQKLVREHTEAMIHEANRRAAAADKQVKDIHAAQQAAQARRLEVLEATLTALQNRPTEVQPQSDGGLANVILDVVTMINPVAGGIMKVMAAPHATGYRN